MVIRIFLRVEVGKSITMVVIIFPFKNDGTTTGVQNIAIGADALGNNVVGGYMFVGGIQDNVVEPLQIFLLLV